MYYKSCASLNSDRNQWSMEWTDLISMDRAQGKILRTILGLPLYVSVNAMHILCGTIPIKFMATYKQLIFIRNTLGLPSNATPRQLVLYRASVSCPALSIVATYTSQLELMELPSIQDLASDLPIKRHWKALVKTLIYEAFRESITSSWFSFHYITNFTTTPERQWQTGEHHCPLPKRSHSLSFVWFEDKITVTCYYPTLSHQQIQTFVR